MPSEQIHLIENVTNQTKMPKYDLQKFPHKMLNMFAYLEMKNLQERTRRGRRPRAQFQIPSYTPPLAIIGFRMFEPIRII